MKNSATIESLKGMRFGAMATELERQLQDPATYAHISLTICTLNCGGVKIRLLLLGIFLTMMNT